MDIHLNTLKIEEGYKKVPLSSVSFRDIDQEFIIVYDDNTYGSDARNNLYYCFIKPYEGIFFRLIGIADEIRGAVKVDEDRTRIKDVPYASFSNKYISKIIENGDLISNQLIVDMPFDYYESNEDLEELFKTRKLEWLDDIRLKSNPDYIRNIVDGIKQDCKLISCCKNGVVAETKDGVRVEVAE